MTEPRPMRPLLLAAMLCGGCLFATAMPVHALVVDGVAAVVNDEAILVSEINDAMRPLIREYQRRYSGEDLRRQLRELQDTIVTKAIEDKLVLQVAKKNDITADEGQVKERFDAVVARFGGIAAFEEEIARRGITTREYREQIRDQVIVQDTIRSVLGAKVRVTENEIETYYHDHPDDFELAPARRLRVIFLGFSPDMLAFQRERIRARAQQIVRLAEQGFDFGELAKKFSDGPHRDEGGDIGFVARGEVLPDLEEAAFAAEVGGPPTIVETPTGIHILVAAEERPGRVVALSEARPRIQATLTEQKQNERYQKWIDGLKAESFIDRKL